VREGGHQVSLKHDRVLITRRTKDVVRLVAPRPGCGITWLKMVSFRRHACRLDTSTPPAMKQVLASVRAALARLYDGLLAKSEVRSQWLGGSINLPVAMRLDHSQFIRHDRGVYFGFEIAAYVAGHDSVLAPLNCPSATRWLRVGHRSVGVHALQYHAIRVTASCR
jgi:hypothetical protein